MPDSFKWATKAEIFISNSIIKEGEIFQFSRRRFHSKWQWIGEVLRCYLLHVLPVAVKGAAFFFRHLMQKSKEGQNWGNAAKESIFPSAGTVWHEAANSVKQGGGGKKKGKYEALNRIYGTLPNKEEKPFEYRSRI